MLTGTYEFVLTPVSFEEMKPFMPAEEQEKPEMHITPPPPPHKITFMEKDGLPVGIYESEHGKQIVGNLCYTGDVIRFTALAGTPGDEFFIYSMKISDGVLQGEAYQPNKPHSRLEGKLIS